MEQPSLLLLAARRTLPTKAEQEGVSLGLGEGLRELGSFSVGCCQEGGQFSDGDLLNLTVRWGAALG